MKLVRRSLLPALAAVGVSLALSTAPVRAADQDVTYLLPAPGSLPAITSPASDWLRAPQGSTAKRQTAQVTT